MKKQSTTTTEARKPTHRIYAVTGDGEKSTWTPIGACWPHKDGKGFSISCDAIPLQGRIVIREARAEMEGGRA
jgi:hypothetical protein